MGKAPQQGKVTKVLLCEPRGFCAGVEMAIGALEEMLRRYELPIYCYHDIVHNSSIVEDFKSRGVIFVDNIDEVPEGSPLMLSAHGSAPEIVAEARTKTDLLVDSICPLVRKVHHEISSRASSGFRILYVGHEGHDEAEAAIRLAPHSTDLVQSVSDFEKLPKIKEPVALLAQTTLSMRDWEELANAVTKKYPKVFTPRKSDLCFATTNRQEALLAIAPICDSVIVAGSPASSNAKSLVKIARSAGVARVALVDIPSLQLPSDLQGTVGVISAASTPEAIVTEIVDLLDPIQGTETYRLGSEEEYFPLPAPLR